MQERSEIFIGLGANLDSDYGPPRETLGAALASLNADGVKVIACSPWYQSAPVPVSDQPWYVNGVASVETSLSPEALLDKLLGLETGFGRVRTVANAPRVCDLDLLDYRGRIIGEEAEGPDIPHPRMHQRAFVMLPLQDLAPHWVHPVLKASVSALVKTMPAGQETVKMEPASGLYGTEWQG